MKKNPKKNFSNGDIMENYKEALKRSGYVMESRIIKNLNKIGCFVDPNQCIKDKATGKSREIDIIVEYFDVNFRGEEKVAVKTKFIIEAINNIHPLVLITERGWSPNSIHGEYLRFFTTPTQDNNPFIGKIDIETVKVVEFDLVHSQYCTFTEKKANGDLMAYHSDDLHSSFEKLAAFIDGEPEGWNEHSDEYWRLFFYQPVLVLSRDLLKMTEGKDGDIDLVPINRGHLEYNYYRNDTPKSILIDLVVESDLEKYIAEKTAEDRSLEEQMASLRKRMKAENEAFSKIVAGTSPP